MSIDFTWSDEELRQAGRDVEQALRVLENLEQEDAPNKTVVWCVLAHPLKNGANTAYVAELRPNRKHA